MTSVRLIEDAVSLAFLDVVGYCSETGFVLHAGLVADGGTRPRLEFGVIHMEPPLGDVSSYRFDLCGTAHLAQEEIFKIRMFVLKHLEEHAELRGLRGLSLLRRLDAGYCVYPHAIPLRESDGRYVRVRFSCAGFVYEAYKSARLNLLDLNALPYIDLPILKQSYPRFETQLDSPEFRASLGLQGDGPWPVMLCGYLFHALNQPDAEIRSTPFRPRESDAWFV